MIILNILVFILVLGVIILIHEFGHFIVAKKCGVLVYEFAFGMGPLLVGKKKGETLFSIRAVPLGGFCSMGGEDVNKAMISKDDLIGLNLDENGKVKEFILNPDLMTYDVQGKIVDYDVYGQNKDSILYINLEQNEEIVHYEVLRNALYSQKTKANRKAKSIQIVPRDRSFEAKPLWQRFLVVLAGPLMNFILAAFIFLLLAIVDVNRYQPSKEPIIGELSTLVGNPLQKGDRIIKINDEAINTWNDISNWKNNPSTYLQVDLVVLREQLELTFYHVPTMISIYAAGIYNFTTEGTLNTSSLGAVVGQSSELAKDIKAGDIITGIKIGNIITSISNWDDLINFFINNTQGGMAYFQIIRDNNPIEVASELYSKKLLVGQGLDTFNASVGISPQRHFNFGYMITSSAQEFGKNAVIIFTTLGQLFTGDVKITQLSGPVGIFKVVGSAMTGGIINILFLIGLLSVNVGIMNLLPIPALDGGRLLFFLYELIFRRKINPKAENIVNTVFYILLLAFMAVVVVFDVMKLF